MHHHHHKNIHHQISTYSVLELFPDEGLEHVPYDVEDHGLLHEVHLLQPERHSVLDEGQETLGERWG